MIKRGYRIYKPSSPSDILIKELVEGIDYLVDQTVITWNENENLTGGNIEYRYVVAFDDDIEGNPSEVFSILNLTPPSNITITPNDYDKVTLNFANVEHADSYFVSIMKVSDYTTVEQALSSDKIISGLEEETQYSIKVKSVNSFGSTVFSDPIYVTTLKVLRLTGLASDNNTITWSWLDAVINSNIDHYELYDSYGYFIANTGLNKTFTENNLPVQAKKAYLREVNKDYSSRNSDIVSVDVYRDGEISTKLSQLVNTYYLVNKYVSVHYDTRNLVSEYIEKILTYSKFIKEINSKLSVSTNNTNISDVYLKVANSMLDCNVISTNFYNDNLKEYFYTQQKIYNNLPLIELFKIGIFKDYNLGYNFNFGISKNIEEILNIRPTILTSGRVRTGAKSLILQNEKLPMNMRMIIDNILADNYPYISKINNYFEDTLTYLRFITHNPAIPFDIKNLDIIWNTIYKDIKLISNINKMRILCIGDSITAGAPAYDPKYGGTVYMADLVTGKVITKNNKESQYPYWLQVRLGTDDYEVINEGTGRQISEQVAYGITDLMKLYRPQFVIVLIGTNDLFSAQDRSQEEINNTVQNAVNNIITTAEIIKSYGAKPIIGTNIPRNSIVPPRAKDGLRALNTGIKQYGTANSLDIIDWYDLFVIKDHKVIDGEDIYVETGVLRYDLSGDDTHPNVEGYKQMAEAINLSTFNSFRAVFRIFRSLKQGVNDVDYATEESKVQPSPYEINYTMTLPENMKRLQNYSITRYMKNTGNSWGMYIMEIVEQEDIVKLWDEKTNTWTKTITGQLAPSDIKEIRTKFTMPSVGRIKEVNLKITFIEFRR